MKTEKTIDIKKVMIIAGGTGGHVIPALSVAKQFRTQGVTVQWMGTRAGMEAHLVHQADFPLSFIEVGGLRGHGWQRWAKAPFMLMRALWQAYCIIKKEQPTVVLCMGGYVSGPGALAAWLQRIPFLVHEQNAIEGWTNRCLSPLAKRIMVAFPGAFPRKRQKVVCTGNPIREEIIHIPSPDKRLYGQTQAPARLRVLVLGGSLGAMALNEIVPRALALFPVDERPIVRHQAGKKHLAVAQANYQQYGIEAEVTDFIMDMAGAYQWADVVICRSGALTVSEIASVGVASILIPFPYAIDDHQTHNARYLSDQKAAILLPQSALSENGLYHILKQLMEQPHTRLEMARLSRECSKPQATTQVVEQCIEVGCGR